MGKIIWLASYPKSGNAWMRTFLYNLTNKSDKPASINQLDKLSFSASSASLYSQFTDKPSGELSYDDFSYLRPKVHRGIAAARAGYNFLKTHSSLGESCGMPTITPDVTAGAIYIVRNPLDVCVSFSNHTGLGIDETIDLMCQENTAFYVTEIQVIEPVSFWSMNVKSWTHLPQPQLMVLRYEDMLDIEGETFNKVAKFLRIDATESKIRKALKFLSFQELRKQEGSQGFKEQGHSAKLFFNRGQKEQYIKVLSGNQIKALVDAHREQMERFDYIPTGY